MISLSTERFETAEEIKYIKWVQALTSQADIEEVTSSDEGQESDGDSDADESSGDNDEEEQTIMANKFAALASQD